MATPDISATLAQPSEEEAALQRQLEIQDAAVSFFSLFRYATAFDLFLLAISSACAIVAGSMRALSPVRHQQTYRASSKADDASLVGRLWQSFPDLRGICSWPQLILGFKTTNQPLHALLSLRRTHRADFLVHRLRWMRSPSCQAHSSS
jgi:hypothetical protein